MHHWFLSDVSKFLDDSSKTGPGENEAHNKHFLRTMMLDYFCPIVNSDLAFLEVYSV